MAVVSATCAAVVASTAGPRRDLDYWWHVMLGRALAAGDEASAASWSVWPADPTWRTAQPLAEIALAAADRWWASAAPSSVRAATAAMAMATLAAVTRPWAQAGGAATASRWWAFTWGAVVVLGFTQERPAQVGLMLMPLVGAVAAWWAEESPCPRARWLLFGGVGVAVGGVWSVSHQSWLLGWTVVAVATLLSPRAVALRAAALALLALVMAWSWCWLGPPWRAIVTAGAASSLAEWQPTKFLTIPGAPAMAMVVACAATLVVTWRAGPTRRWLPGDAARYGTLLVLAVACASAWRHVPVTVLAAGPILVAHVGAHLGQPAGGQVSDLPQPPPRATVSWRAAAIGLVLVVSALALHLWSQIRPAGVSEADRVALLAARHACHWGAPGTIATHYNDSGPALAGARSAPCPHAGQMRVVIDGRADRYGADALRRWQDVLDARGPRWEDDWRAMAPDLAILGTESPLRTALRQQGWHVAEIRDSRVVLYRR